jgi:hypothetical protein
MEKIISTAEVDFIWPFNGKLMLYSFNNIMDGGVL